MLTLGELTKSPQRLNELGGCDALIAAKGGGEVVVYGKGGKREPTMLFQHETIHMMKAERVDAMQKLTKALGEGSVVVPLRKKPDSVWDHITLGRSSSADIVVDDAAISAVHANFALNVEKHPVSVQDVGSSNGTFVNRVPLQPHTLTKLQPGDCVRFGQTVFYYVTHAMIEELIGVAPSP
jgi:hypothetical protein